MFALIILIIFGLGIAFFATQNTGIVHLVFGNYLITGIPLYVVVVGAMLLGIFISWLISIVNSISSFMTLHVKDTALREDKKIIKDLQRKNNELEKELAQYKPQAKVQEEEVSVEHPSLFQRLRNNFA